MSAPQPADQTSFGDLLRVHRERRGLTLTGLAEKCGMDGGNLSRIERGERMPPKMPVLQEVLKALRVPKDSAAWRAFMSAAARGRLEILDDPSGIAYLPFENTLHGLPEQTRQVPTYTVTQAAAELGRVQEKLGIKKITVEASDGSQFVFPIEDLGSGGGKTPGAKKP
jgi:transcriptional regulator with XRE-family HTH domain